MDLRSITILPILALMASRGMFAMPLSVEITVSQTSNTHGVKPPFCDFFPNIPECNLGLQLSILHRQQCEINPYYPGCPSFCKQFPQFPECENDSAGASSCDPRNPFCFPSATIPENQLCREMPYLPGCPYYCRNFPGDPICSPPGGPQRPDDGEQGVLKMKVSGQVPPPPEWICEKIPEYRGCPEYCENVGRKVGDYLCPKPDDAVEEL